MMKVAINGMLRACGFQMIKLPGASEYGTVLPVADFCPWNTDPEFLATYEKIRQSTLVDIYRCWELWTLVGQTCKTEPGAILEIGVWRGGTGALMAKRASLASPGRLVYLCDTFQGVVKAGEKDTYYTGGEHSDTGEEVVLRLLNSLQLKNTATIKGIFPDETGHLLADARFALVHIDVDTYQSAKDIMEWTWDRLIPGGVVVYDDYGFKICDGIKTLVNEQANDPGKLVIHNLNGHGLIVKI
jgi:O-methyltransferase